MYLALIPDEQTTKALRAFAPALPSDAHCTIIHSKTLLPEKGLLLPHMSNAELFNIEIVETEPAGIEVFGAKYKVRVLKLKLNYELSYLRAGAEQILTEQRPSIPWSKDWAFSPHVTLGGASAQLVGEPPAVLRFDRMEWRP